MSSLMHIKRIEPSNPSQRIDVCYKILIICESRVGKSSILKRLQKNEFHDSTISTVGLDFISLVFDIDNVIVKLQIWYFTLKKF